MRPPIISSWSHMSGTIAPRDRRPPNMRLKLTARGGRQIGNGSVLIAAAAGRSLSAIR